jgi:hypothetical protein
MNRFIACKQWFMSIITGRYLKKSRRFFAGSLDLFRISIPILFENARAVY